MNIPRIEQIAEILNVSTRTAYRYKAKGEQFVLIKLAQAQNKTKGLRKTNIHYAGDFTDNATANVSDNCHNNTLTDDISKLTNTLTKLTDKIEELTVKIGSLEKTLNETLSSKNTVTTDTGYDILLTTDTANSDNPSCNTTDAPACYTPCISANTDNFTDTTIVYPTDNFTDNTDNFAANADNLTANTDKKADSCQYKGGIIGGIDSDSTKTMFQLNQDDAYVTNLDSIETVTRNSKKEKTNKKEKRSRISSKTYNIFPEIKEEIFDFFVQRGFSHVEQWVELTREFMEHRCELKKAYTSFKKLSDSRFFPNLIELSQGDIIQAQALVRNAIAENWHTVYAIKNPHSIGGYRSKKDLEQERYREGFKRFMGDIDIEGVMNGSITTEADFLYGDAAEDFLFKR